MWPIVREIIKTAIENEQNLIDEIIEHESDLEARLIKEDCTIDDLKQCNRWFIDAFGSAGERVVLVEGDYDKTLGSLLS